MSNPTSDRDPRAHVRQIREHLDHTVRHLREGVGKVDDPKAQALFETSAEVIRGLETAFEHYEQKSEEAWK